MKKCNIEKMIEEMSLEELCGQLLNLSITKRQTLEEFEEVVKKVRPCPKEYPRKAGTPSKKPIGISAKGE